MKRIFLLALILSILFGFSSANAQKKWWEKWPNFPKGLRITASQVKKLQQSGEPLVFVYAGYEVDEILCGSLIIPYIKVPPNADGSAIPKLSIPRNWWIISYCP